jgi:molybdenum cofactor cytidylyltransferase
VLAKRERVMSHRLAALGSELAATLRVAHEPEAVRGAIEALKKQGLDPILVFAASAIVDRNDVIPAAVTAAGGEIVHLGMPVDPGNLLMLGRLDRTDVVGVPSCAGSPKLNGFDWVLERRLAGLPVGREEIAGMGVGGLLKEIATRPQPRDAEDDSARREKRIGIVILAAGRSSRMGGRNKLTEEVDGRPIVRHVAEAALASRGRPVVVVTGHQADAVAAKVEGLDLRIVHNPDFADGMSTSLRAGIAALPDGLDGAVVALGDMPGVGPAHLDRLIAAFEPKEGRSIVVPVFEGRRGNPVLWGAEHFAAMMAVEGDTGARQVIADNAESVVEVDLKSNAVLVDVDTPEALARLRDESSGA